MGAPCVHMYVNVKTRAIIDRMSATASRNSKEAFDNLIWGFNLGPRFPSIGINRTDTFLSLIRVDHENLKLLRPKTKLNQSDQSIANSFLSCPANSKCPRIVVSFCVFVKCCLFPKNLYYQYTSYTVVTSIVPDCTMQQVLTK